jgi:tetratricopeptide (TPR) repeat protein
MSDRLRPLWDYDDLDATAARFRDRLEHEESDAGRAEVLSQLARVESMRSDFERCAELLDEAEPLAGSDPVVNTRLELERGRMFRSSGDLEAAFPLFKSAFERACEAHEFWFAGDAAHMCAIAVTDRDLMEEWTQRGLDLGERQPDAAYWAGPLLNNLGWAYFDEGEHERALELFERALDVRERDPGNPAAIQLAKEAVEEARQALGGA